MKTCITPKTERKTETNKQAITTASVLLIDFPKGVYVALSVVSSTFHFWACKNTSVHIQLVFCLLGLNFNLQLQVCMFYSSFLSSF